MRKRKAIGLVASIAAACLGLMAPTAGAFPLPDVSSDASCTTLVDAPLPGLIDVYSISLCPAAGGFSAIATSVAGLTFGTAVSQDALHGNLTLLLRQGDAHSGLGNELALTLHCGQLGPPCTLTAASSGPDLDPLAIITLGGSDSSITIPPLGVRLPARSSSRRHAHRHKRSHR